VLALLTLGSPAISTAQSSKSGDTYEWSAELVSIDPSNSTLTLKPRVAYPEAVSELKQFKPGERVTIRIKVPASSLAAVKGVNPTEWVTVTSRHRPSTDAEAVVAVKPYAATTQ